MYKRQRVECTQLGENIKEVKKQVESKADRDEVHQKVELQLKVMREDLTKAMKSQQTKVVRCGSYKEVYICAKVSV